MVRPSPAAVCPCSPLTPRVGQTQREAARMVLGSRETPCIRRARVLKGGRAREGLQTAQ